MFFCVSSRYIKRLVRAPCCTSDSAVRAGLGQILHQVSKDQCANLMLGAVDDRLLVVIVSVMAV